MDDGHQPCKKCERYERELIRQKRLVALYRRRLSKANEMLWFIASKEPDKAS
jgi:hypothetical protein